MTLDKKPKSPSKIEIPADISAADARPLIDSIRAELGGRRKSLTIDLVNADAPPSISAIQILVSLQATTSKVAITLGQQAQDAINAYIQPTTLEMQT